MARIAQKLRAHRGTLAYLGAVAISIYALSLGLEAHDQTCSLFERDHADDVQRLVNTYDYLKSLSPEELKDPLNEYVVERSLPALEAEARTDSAPPFCDGKDLIGRDLGAPEPDPEVPARPAELRDL